MGAKSLLSDLGLDLDIRVSANATTAEALASIRGLGNMRHIAVHELWVREHAQNKTFTLVKIKNKFKPPDILTTCSTRAEYGMIMEFVKHKFQEGRSKSAPKFALLNDKPRGHDQEVHKVEGQNLICYSTGVGVAM